MHFSVECPYSDYALSRHPYCLKFMFEEDILLVGKQLEEPPHKRNEPLEIFRKRVYDCLLRKGKNGTNSFSL